MTDWPDDPHDESDDGIPTAAELLEQIEDLQNSGNYDWASDTLEGIHQTVEQSGVVTENQQRAVDNIDEGGRRGR